MKTKPPSLELQKKLINKWRAACDYQNAQSQSQGSAIRKNAFYLSSTIWGDMLDLIYSGNSKVAFKLLDEFWAPAMCAQNLEYNERDGDLLTRRGRFKELFLEQLCSSEFFNQLKQMNPDDVDLKKVAQTRNSEPFFRLIWQ